jgi:amino acid transporter
MMQVMSIWGPLIYAGCFAATLSTALTNLLSVPRLIQALGIDRIYPGLIFFSKGYGKSGEPYRGYVLTFLISTAFLLIGKFQRLQSGLHCIRFVDFTAAEVDQIFSGYQPGQLVQNYRRYRDHLCPDYQGFM